MIVIPMAGLSSRFTKAGYPLPKYMLPLGERTVFDHAVGSFQGLFSSEEFLFIIRNVEDTSRFVKSRSHSLGIRSTQIVSLDAPTMGQAHTVARGVCEAAVGQNTPLTIFNIDTFRPGYHFPESCQNTHGYLEVFEGEGYNWSFAEPAFPGSSRVVRTSEKDPISRFCCTGLYHFSRATDFLLAFEAQRDLPKERLQAGELYVAPLYNELIARGRDIRMHVVKRDEVIFCGVPAEYEALLNSEDQLKRERRCNGAASWLRPPCLSA
jgi:hypothetical protein